MHYEVWKIKYEYHDSVGRVEPPALLTGEFQGLTWRVTLKMVTAENGDIQEWSLERNLENLEKFSWWTWRAKRGREARSLGATAAALQYQKSARLSPFNFPSRAAAECHN